MGGLVAWLLFISGAIFITVSIVRLQIDGLFLLGVLLLLLWAWLIGAFTRAFWINDDPRLAEIDMELDAADRKDLS